MSGKALKIGLAVSLAVNLFVIGAVVGVLGAQARYEARREAPRGNPLMAAGARLPDEVRTAYMSRLRQEGRQAGPRLSEARRERMEAARLMGQGDYDAAAIAAALGRARDAEVLARAELEGAVVEFASGLTQEQRRVLAQALRLPPGEGGRGRGPGYGGRPGRGPMGPPGGPPYGRPPADEEAAAPAP